MQADSQIKVWDPLIRLFHWSLVIAFAVAFVTEEDFLLPHVWAGYFVVLALLLRVIWGFIGTRHARFSDFVTSPMAAIRYGKDALMFRAKRYIGHNPAGGLMILIMLLSLLITTVSGVAVYGAGESAGPMAAVFSNSGETWEDALEAVHEFFANFTLFLVVIHLGGVLIESILHKENLVSAMFSGLKRAK